MYKRLVPLAAITLLAGCSTVNHQELHQSTLNAIKTSEQHLDNRLTNLDLQLSNQSDYIDSLESEVIALTERIETLQSNQDSAVEKLAEPTKQAPPTPTVNSSKPVLLGSVEKVDLDILNRRFDARVDTGAVTSSLNATDIQIFERDGKQWVKFHLLDDKAEKQEKRWIEAPVIRYVKIRQSTNEKAERRAVIELWIRVGNIHEKAQFTLADRSQMTHPILLGREFIKDIALVDVSQQYILSSNE
ncbi:ATP-dependent zinc protease family protein [Vibrio methylphosphonaticus]|uniref:ATP-dependent zinc protease family protein n=1 Tax=Vibrio methylphosphonaticus TaxID=2946866 RepID=UPI00202A7F97|nr:ATP-dependent zinc protease [Vibrio methylphosphonaticus]MCL9774720.1 ATP-dependent zinc protease [Vibrio methylphosphonaticus]